MDVGAGPTTKIITDVGTSVAGGVIIASFAGLLLWMRRLVSLPKRMVHVEQSTAVLLSSQIPLIDAALFGIEGRRSADKSQEADRIKKDLAEERKRLLDHLTKINKK